MAYQTPNKIITGNATFIATESYWIYNDTLGDPWLPAPFRFTYDIAITARNHSSHLVKDLGTNTFFTGLDVKEGDWVTNDNAARAWKIIRIVWLNESAMRVVLEDVDRTIQFARDDGTGGNIMFNGDVVIFEAPDDVPMISNLPSIVAGTLSLDWSSQILARFSRMRAIGTRTYKPAHGFQNGQLLRLAAAADVVGTHVTFASAAPTLNSLVLVINNKPLTITGPVVGASAIATAINAQMPPDGIFASTFTTQVRLSAASGVPIEVYQQGGDTSLTTDLGAATISTSGVALGSLMSVGSESDKAVAVVTEQGGSPDYFYYKWLGTPIPVLATNVVSGSVGSIVYMNTSGQFSTTKPSAVAQAFVLLSAEANATISSPVSATTTATAIVINKTLVTLTGPGVSDAVTSINAGTATHGVTATNPSGALILVAGGGTPIKRDIQIADHFTPAELFVEDFRLKAFTAGVPFSYVLPLMRGAAIAQAASLTVDTVVKTAAFTASVNHHYLVNTTGAAFSITMPTVPAPVTGDSIMITDVGGFCATNFATCLTTAQKFHGQSNDFALTQNNGVIKIKYQDSTQGWLRVSDV